MKNPIWVIKHLAKRIRKLSGRFRQWCTTICTLSPGHWKWAVWGILSLMGLFIVGLWIDFTGIYRLGLYLLALLYFVGLPLLAGLAGRLGLRILNLLPREYNWIYFGAVFFVFFFFGIPEKGKLIIALLLLLTGSFLGAALYNLTGKRWAGLSRIHRALTLFFLITGSALFIVGSGFLLFPGKAPEEVKAWSMETPHLPALLEITDPTLPGPFQVDSLTYGWGRDLRREEYGDGADLITPTVDGSNFLDGWKKLSGKLRTAYWGMGPDSLALNGRVWYPVGEGTFPLVLMVHGNHSDRDFSDPGYAYLGRHFASLGIIAVSVDENFLNGAWSNFDKGLQTENDCRGWLLLKHLELWRNWNQSDSTRFFHRVDLDRVVLIGHSRGGEAVSIASLFNRLPFYPDNADEVFDFNFGIRGVAAIAPVDGQYYPAGKRTPLSNVNYFTIQGSMDADLRSYDGLRQMLRVEFSDSLYNFASGLYLHGANHGQFNRSWGIFDIGYPNQLLLNRKAIIPVESQEKVLLTYLTAFVMENVHPGSGYLDLFKDYRSGRKWLPNLVMLNQFRESDEIVLCDFEEDMDITTGSHHVERLEGRELAMWKEGKIPKKWGNYETNGVFLGWNNEQDTVPATFTIVLDSSDSGFMRDAGSLVFLAADAQLDPGDRMDDGEGKEGNEKTKDDEVEMDKTMKDESEHGEKEQVPPDFSIILTDAAGNSYRLRMGDYQKLQPPIKPTIFKSKLFWKDQESEVIPQYVALPLDAFVSDHQGPGDVLESGNHLKTIEPLEIRSICFEFDAEGKGAVIIDQIGFSRHNYFQQPSHSQ